jgi:hypothetical protein
MTQQDYSSVLYYSVIFPGQYDDILKIVSTKICKENSGLYVKRENSFDSYFQQKLSPEEKDEISKTYQKNIQETKDKEVFIIYDGVFYKVNDEFHITTLFTGGKPVAQNDEMEAQHGKELQVKLNKLAISKSFIVIGVDTLDCIYYGNSVKHITIGLSKSGKKVFPKDSYTALSDGTIYNIDDVLHGLTSKFTK